MRKVFLLKTGWALVIFAFLDLVCKGLGMGVPFFCILLGLPIGCYLAGRITARPFYIKKMLSDMLSGAVLTSGFTFVLMVLIWGPWCRMLFDPAADLKKLGAPLILYEPSASFIGRLVLMIVVSPFLQLLMTLLGSHLTMLWRIRGTEGRARRGPALLNKRLGPMPTCATRFQRRPVRRPSSINRTNWGTARWPPFK